MAKYGTKQYWNEEMHKEEVKFELMCRGFADMICKTQSIALEDVQEMVDALNNCSNIITFDKSQRDQAEDEIEEDEE